jgi:hypothetical protein
VAEVNKTFTIIYNEKVKEESSSKKKKGLLFFFFFQFLFLVWVSCLASLGKKTETKKSVVVDTARRGKTGDVIGEYGTIKDDKPEEYDFM